MFVFVALVIYGVFVGIDKYTHHGEAIVVPDVKGMSFIEADAIFKRYGLTSVVGDSVYVKTELPGRVLDYNPAAGKKVKQGRIIYLTINTNNIPLRPVPDVADNSSVRQAHARMLAVGFKLDKDERISGQKDWVYDVKYQGVILEAGAMVPVGATLTLLVGDGSEIQNDSIKNELDSLELINSLSNDLEENTWFQ